MRSVDSRKDFLRDDLSDALKGLFVSAVVWKAADRTEKAKEKELCPFLKGIAASATFLQARALYEFYNPDKTDKPKGEKGEPAHASHFGRWTKREFTTGSPELFERYIEGQKATGVFRKNSPANKRVSSISRMIGATFREGQDQMAPIISRTNRSSSRRIYATSLKDSSPPSTIVFVTAP